MKKGKLRSRKRKKEAKEVKEEEIFFVPFLPSFLSFSFPFVPFLPVNVSEVRGRSPEPEAWFQGPVYSCAQAAC